MLKLTMLAQRRQWRLSDESSSEQRSNLSSSVRLDMLSETMCVMLRVEESTKYRCTDYLKRNSEEQHVRQRIQVHHRGNNESRRGGSGNSRRSVDEYCREQICEWMYRVVDYFHIDREVVSISLFYLDRFLSTCTLDRSTFKLAATTTLYLAVKLFHPRKLGDLGTLSDLSRGEFGMEHVSKMETLILKALSWHLHPPTSVSFVTTFLELVPTENTSNDDRDSICHVACFFTELAVCDYFFVSRRASVVALASILNAMEGLFGNEEPFASGAEKLLDSIEISFDEEEVMEFRDRLWELYERSEECAARDINLSHKSAGGKASSNTNKNKTKAMSIINISSPVCVSNPE